MKVLERANAKINLFLDVTERREDGFHNIVSVMQSVSLCDTLTLDACYSDETKIRLSCDDTSLPVDENNLIYKSALKYLAKFNISADINIELEKRIPIGAGLGGGSSDAAATLRALNCVFNLASESELLDLAAELGSDVPFCLIGGRALCTGRGEKVSPILDYPVNYFVIAIGKERVSTPAAYRALDEKYDNFSKEGYTPKECDGRMFNIFESVTNISEINEIKKIMAKYEAESAMMSGSGPSVFGIYADESKARTATEALIDQGFSAYYCHSSKG